MGLESLYRQMVLIMKAIGKMICKRAMGKKRPVVVGGTRVSTKMGSSMGLECILGLVAVSTMESGATIPSAALVSMSGQMAEDTMVTGRTSSCTGRARISVKTGKCTRANIRTTRSTDTELIRGPQINNTKAIGGTASSMAKEYIGRTEQRGMESGRMGRG